MLDGYRNSYRQWTQKSALGQICVPGTSEIDAHMLQILRRRRHRRGPRSFDDTTLYVSVRFMDGTNFCIRYASNMFVVGVDLSDWKSDDMNMIREYIKPIRNPGSTKRSKTNPNYP